jgi:hypothetical protein
MGIARWGSQARRIRKDGKCKTGIDRKMNNVKHKFKGFLRQSGDRKTGMQTRRIRKYE